MTHDTDGFSYRDGELYCEDVRVQDLCEQHGTPLYIYSHDAFVRRFKEIDDAFKGTPLVIAYAMKSNSNLAILRAMARHGAGADIVSGGELFRALKAGVDPKKIVFAGVGKSDDEISDALDAGILLFNVESVAEAHAISRVAQRKGVDAPIALRINPDVDAKTHQYTTTGKKGTKFGVDLDVAIEAYEEMRGLPNLDICAVHAHIGSPVRSIDAYEEALKRLVDLIDNLRALNFDIRLLNFGGGLPILYKDDETAFHPDEYAARVKPLVQRTGCVLILEPGRFISGNSGILCTRVMFRKETDHKTFVIVDGAMNDLIRPALYDGYHRIHPVIEKSDERETVDVVGPVCESGDFLAKGREIMRAEQGEYLAVFSAGAYGFAMASNYNSRPRTPEIMVVGDATHVIRERESYEDLIRGESIPDFLWNDPSK
ncbi:MAG: diaminopimelate decarboxylase [Candidatus Poribacteria bacterium]|nr:diaminopimelate decarboxylase [Candidatus Poribacteria bacterium]